MLLNLASVLGFLRRINVVCIGVHIVPVEVLWLLLVVGKVKAVMSKLSLTLNMSFSDWGVLLDNSGMVLDVGSRVVNRWLL